MNLSWDSLQDIETLFFCKLEITAAFNKTYPKNKARVTESQNHRITESQNHRITESQNGRGWKGPLWVI